MYRISEKKSNNCIFDKIMEARLTYFHGILSTGLIFVSNFCRLVRESVCGPNGWSWADLHFALYRNIFLHARTVHWVSARGCLTAVDCRK